MALPSFIKRLDISGFNACILPRDDGYVGLIRTCIQHEVREVYPEATNKMYHFTLDSEFNVKSYDELKDITGRQIHQSWSAGFEDPRLINLTTATVVTCDTNSDWLPEVSAITFNESKEVTSVIPFEVQGAPKVPQKNWLYIRPHDDMYSDYLYGSFPFHIVRIHNETRKGFLIKSIHSSQSYIAHNGAIVKIKDGYLLTVRIKKEYDYNYSLWIRFNDDLDIVGVSKPFWFAKSLTYCEDGSIPITPYEMCMSLHLDADMLVACVSVNDDSVYIQKYALCEVLATTTQKIDT